MTYARGLINETIWIVNGMQYSIDDFEANSRLKTVVIFVNGEKFGTIELLDQMGPQKLVLEGISRYQTEDSNVEIQLIIEDIYSGKEYPEAGITEIFSRE